MQAKHNPKLDSLNSFVQSPVLAFELVSLLVQVLKLLRL